MLPNAASGTRVITVTFSGAIAGTHAVFLEYYNVATSSPVGLTTKSAAPVSPSIQPPSFAPTSGNLVLNYVVDNKGTVGGESASNVSAWAAGSSQNSGVPLHGARGRHQQHARYVATLHAVGCRERQLDHPDGDSDADDPRHLHDDGYRTRRCVRREPHPAAASGSSSSSSSLIPRLLSGFMDGVLSRAGQPVGRHQHLPSRDSSTSPFTDSKGNTWG